MSLARDRAFMHLALALADRGAFTTTPNPRVGCVIAKGATLLGQGWHERAGQAHAEVNALRDAGEAARGATAYVTLEPCGNHGRTPPCVDALIAAGVARVVVASADRSQHDNQGMARLSAAGVVVEHLPCPEARELNQGFFSRIERQRPWVRVRLAKNLDGRAAWDDLQAWRARACAVLTCSDTLHADNPSLTVYLPDPQVAFIAPLRVVLDQHLAGATDAHVRDGEAATLIVHGPAVVPRGAPPGGVRFRQVGLKDGRLDLHQIMTLLAEEGCNEIQVEAGAQLCDALAAADLVDEWLAYVAPLSLHSDECPMLEIKGLESLTETRQLSIVEQCLVGENLRLRLRPVIGEPA
ncbi:bifunctional diaminohydroxyphosphoribosylaminopyrimidine deaminase/5-amino-6-(5-phosphoribosylamino)uracil reductase RibD [Pseudomonas fontis]|uniref:Riboflavin biosynthesis protein RibD n=1 Tax=Pseudomonas fontis TaxID=2942633 RepID=A0ABT5NQB6_9PSED|nr:bifunctional diaminohydroxyphosphoribosylaminopyrimidine deaminase/5-amino-6-(5-phosphoribosylamino)uracil reductase RibD [Pseudomonas fontis]MDD0975018.1 bifunctional diaminohydroxyphosphoribosylaminopyrimidine deaminase/5-amino-6-(5-phosphoribosylamino)uracil reductase RibD [Pseudomonas fontis]MDD0990358.1 bifunctional diaminohydroxyphosphoribosylaminopyrimidine deaminase/5-amino-6-(5-phosphoribosylamino)uracil reductase RibD [Pseudomonas fontis]